MALIEKLTAIGDAIREKTGKTDLLTLDQMPAEIASISGGGDSSADIKAMDEMLSASWTATEYTNSRITCIGSRGCYSIGTGATAPFTLNFPNVVEVKSNGFNGITKYCEVINLPKLTTIRANGFYGVSAKNLNFENVETIEYGAFQYSDAETINLPKITELTANSIFANCSKLKTLTLGGKLKNVPPSTFEYCSILTGVDFSEMETIQSNGFKSNSALTEVMAPKLTNIAASSFYYCRGITKIDMPELITMGAINSGSIFYFCDALTDVNLPKLELVPTDGFYCCKALPKLDLPRVSQIGSYAFGTCEKLETLILRRTDGVCSLAHTNAFNSTPILKGTGYIYVPAALIEDYKLATNWSTFTNQLRAIEDYPDICG